MKLLLRTLDRFFNRLYTSQYNPLYRSGSIALGLFSIALVTGVYLSLFYRLSEPYESVLALQNNLWFGQWIRGLHRYSSDLSVLVIVIHVLRMFSQGKTWGPRTLAWVSGVVLLIMLLLTSWTGFVMVWDEQGQAVASAGAKIFDSLGIFSDPVSRSFNGVMDPPASFFFLNLFLHIVFPLAMVFGLWLHTSKIARAVWLPNKKILYGMIATLTAASLLWPPPLGNKAELLKAPGSYPTDWFYNFWVPWVDSAPLTVFFGFIGFLTLLASFPLWVRPLKKNRPSPSFNDPRICQGCTQCAQDCPYEAIQMVFKTVDTREKNVAVVDPNLCVSCGICAASCEPMTIGPWGRKAGDQLKAARQFLGSIPKEISPLKEKTLIVGCRLQPGSSSRFEALCGKDSTLEYYPVDCAGTIHSAVFERFTQQYSKVLVAACPEGNCTNKDGFHLLNERISGLREPTLSHAELRNKIQIFQVGDGEESRFLKGNLRPKFLRFSAVAITLVLIFAVTTINNIAAPVGPAHSTLRLSFRVSGQSERICRPTTEQEIKNKPRHMRTLETCTQRPLSYILVLRIDDTETISEEIHPGGLKKDRPIYVNREISLPPGKHSIELDLRPVEQSQESAIKVATSQVLEFKSGQIVLLHLSPDQKQILVKGVTND